MKLLFALQKGAECLGVLASAHAIAQVADWQLRILRVACPESPGLASVPAELAAEAEVVDVTDEPLRAVLAASEHPDVAALSFCFAGPLCDRDDLAGQLLRTAPSALLIGRPGMRPVTSVTKILVPLEGSPSSSEAMRQAEDVFCGEGRELIALHVVTSETPDEAGSLPAPRMIDQEYYEWLSWHEEFTMRFSQCPKGGRHRTVVRVGDPKQVIVAMAHEVEADLVIASWNQSLAEGRSQRVRALLEGSPCPLLLVPAPTALAL